MTVPDTNLKTTPGRRAAQPAVALAAYGLAGTGTELPDRPLSDEAWRALARDVGRQRLSGLLMAAVDDGALPVTPEQHAQARAFETLTAARCLHLEGLLVRVGAILAEAGIPMRALKGSAVAHLDYPDTRLRPFIDVDVLVTGSDFDSATACLRDAGLSRVYPQPRAGFDRRFGKGANFLAPDGAGVDVHRTFVMGPYGLTVRLDDLWRSPEPFEAGGGTLLAMSVEARLLHACYHAVLGDWPRRLLPHRDIAQILANGRVDQPALLEMVRGWRGEAVLAMGVLGAWDTFRLPDDHPVARWARRYVVPAADLRRIAVYSNAQHNFAAKSMAAVASIPGLRDKAAFVRALVLPDRSYVLDRHASAATRLLHGLRQVGPWARGEPGQTVGDHRRADPTAHVSTSCSRRRHNLPGGGSGAE